MLITIHGEKKMMRRNKVTPIALLATVILASPLMLVHGQTLTSSTEKVAWVAENAAQKVQGLIDLINADDEALTKIEAAGLSGEYEGNVTLYETDGLATLAAAQESLANLDYNGAVDYAVEALRIFREVYSSIHVIMEKAGFQRDDLIENQGLLDAITRELHRIDRLREILPDGAPQEILNSLNSAAGLLNEAKTLLLEGDVEAAKSAFLDAKTSISEVYDYLKQQATDSNTQRLYNYCEQARERIRERFRYGQDRGVDFSGVLQSFGYQSEEQFMTALQNWAQTAQNEQNFSNALQDCQQLSQMVQQMEQALNQEMSRYGYGPGGSGSGTGFGGSESGYGGTGSGYSGSGLGGNGGYGGSGSGYGGSGGP